MDFPDCRLSRYVRRKPGAASRAGLVNSSDIPTKRFMCEISSQVLLLGVKSMAFATCMGLMDFAGRCPFIDEQKHGLISSGNALPPCWRVRNNCSRWRIHLTSRLLTSKSSSSNNSISERCSRRSRSCFHSLVTCWHSYWSRVLICASSPRFYRGVKSCSGSCNSLPVCRRQSCWLLSVKVLLTTMPVCPQSSQSVFHGW